MFDEKKKSLKIEINHDRTRLGPCGVPLLFGTPERPAVIQGQVVFETDRPCKGGDLEIEYIAQFNIEWSGTSCCSHPPLSPIHVGPQAHIYEPL